MDEFAVIETNNLILRKLEISDYDNYYDDDYEYYQSDEYLNEYFQMYYYDD